MRVAVTGAAGYLAGALLPKLDRLPEVESILAIDIRPLAAAAAARLRKVRFERADVRDADFARLFTDARIDALVHLAFIVMPLPDESAMFDVNVIGSERVFEGAAAAGVKRIVYASSIAAYGSVPGHELPLRETEPRRDQRDFYYAHHKFAVEEYLDRFERAHPEIAVARIRPGVFLGPGIENPVGLFLRAPVVIGISGQPPIQYTADEDVAEAFVLALRRGARGAFNATVEDAISAREVAAALGKPYVPVPAAALGALVRAAGALGRTAVFHPGWFAAQQVPMVATSARARAELGWTPRWPDSRAVVRRFGEVAAAGLPDRGVALFFGALALLAWAAAGRRTLPDAEADLRGLDGDIDIVLTGAGGSAWRLRFDGSGRMRVEPGRSPAPRSTVTLANRDFVRILAGEMDHSTALFTGKVRIEGDGHSTFVLGGLAALFRRFARASGWRGLPARTFASLVLRLADRPPKPAAAPRSGETHPAEARA